MTVNLKKTIEYNYSFIGAIVGNILEHHDKSLFVFLAPFIATKFFPHDDPIIAMIQMYGVLAISLVMKPIGALFFGQMADRKGRKTSLLNSLLGVSFATLCIGFLPTFEKLGVYSSILLLCFRCLQYFFSAGEETNGNIYLLEQTNKYESLISGLFCSSTMIGIFLASAEVSLFAYFDILENYWNWLFIGSGVLGLVGLVFRSKMKESKEFLSLKNYYKFNIRDVFKEKRALLILVVTTSFNYLTFMLSISFINTYLQALTSLSVSELTTLNTMLTALDFIALPLFGYLGLYFRPVTLMAWATFLMALFAFPIFNYMFHSESFWMIFILRLFVVLAGACFAANRSVWAQHLIDPNKRCTFQNVGISIGQLITEGFFALLSLYCLQSHFLLLPAILLTVTGLASTYFLINKQEAIQLKPIEC